MQEVLVNRLGGLSLPRKSVVRSTDRPDMTLDVYRGRKTTMQQQQQCEKIISEAGSRKAHSALMINHIILKDGVRRLQDDSPWIFQCFS